MGYEGWNEPNTADDLIVQAIEIGMEESEVGVASTSNIHTILTEELDAECTRRTINRRLNTMAENDEINKFKPGTSEVFWGISE